MLKVVSWPFLAWLNCSVIYNDGVTHDGSRGLQKHTVCQVTEKYTQRNFIMQPNNNSKHAAMSAKDFIRGNNRRLKPGKA